MQSKRKRIGLLGGSFDPPHLGHLTLAQDAYEGLGLDSVWFIPTFLSPHKNSFHITPQKRVEMVEMMIADDPRFEVCSIEVDSGKTQFSVDTVGKLQELHPNCDFYWLIGADQLDTLHRWKDVEKLAQLTQITVFKRPGWELMIPQKSQHLGIQLVDIHEVMISSSELRDRIGKKLPVYMFLHPAVNLHIEKHCYYKNDKTHLG